MSVFAGQAPVRNDIWREVRAGLAQTYLRQRALNIAKFQSLEPGGKCNVQDLQSQGPGSPCGNAMRTEDVLRWTR